MNKLRVLLERLRLVSPEAPGPLSPPVVVKGATIQTGRFGTSAAPAVGDILTSSTGQWSGSPTSFDYLWQTCSSTSPFGSCSPAGGTPNNTNRYVIASADAVVAHTIRVTVTAHYSGHPDATQQSDPTVSFGGGGGGTLPAGVTTRAIDGGPTYFADNGFTNAANTSFNTNVSSIWANLGWDSPDFFMIGQDYAFNNGTSTATFLDLGLNTSIRVTQPVNPATLRAAGIYMQPQGGEWTGTLGGETTGFSCEEPSGWTTGAYSLTSEMQSAGANIVGRYYQISVIHNQINGAYSDFPGGGPFSNVMKATVAIPGDGNRHVNLPSIDIYFFAKSAATFLQQFEATDVYPGGPFTTAQMARGSNYGDLVDIMRSFVPDFPAPCAAYLETEDGLATDAGVRLITPPELNWADWSMIIHGARRLVYFSATSAHGSGATFGFPTGNITAGGQTRSIYNQAKATHSLVRNVARIINSPFALGYVTHGSGGYVFPTTHLVLDNGLDIMAKYYTGGPFSNASGTFDNGFYIFASVRGAETQTNVTPTFTLAGSLPDGTVIPVIRNAGLLTQASGTVTVANNAGTTNKPRFTDTFATAYAVHIYGPIPNVP